MTQNEDTIRSVPEVPMRLVHALLPEVDEETANTRKLLERASEDKPDSHEGRPS